MSNNPSPTKKTDDAIRHYSKGELVKALIHISQELDLNPEVLDFSIMFRSKLGDWCYDISKSKTEEIE